MIPEAPSGDVGFDVAGGDPDGISAAAAIHSDAADMLQMHAAVVAGAASSLDSAWQGQAAGSYQQLSQVVHSRFDLASDGARTAAAGLQQWADELSRCQHAGKVAMRECEDWLKQQQHWYYQLQDAERELTNAQSQLAAVTAPNPFTGTPPSAPSSSAGPFGNPLSPGSLSAGAIASAKSAVADAQHDVAVAKAKLKEATEQVLEWQAKGRRAWDEAMDAAETATGMLNGIRVTPPPVAGFSRGEPTIRPSEPWYDHVLDIAGDVAGGVAAVAGVTTALTFWVPGVGEVAAATAGAAGGAQASIDWIKVLAHDPNASVGDSAIDTVLAVPGVAEIKGIGDAPEGLASLKGPEGLTGALKDHPVGLSKAVSGTLDGSVGSYGAGTTAKSTAQTLGSDPVEVHGAPAKASPVLAGAGGGAGR
ncbi:MAG TPA: hypothetical protein VMF14_09860 [Solirubrobacteraceae bacterium]|nr:hypothetical protein [Solirubrobacteraceae bacterium]